MRNHIALLALLVILFAPGCGADKLSQDISSSSKDEFSDLYGEWVINDIQFSTISAVGEEVKLNIGQKVNISKKNYRFINTNCKNPDIVPDADENCNGKYFIVNCENSEIVPNICLESGGSLNAMLDGAKYLMGKIKKEN